MLFILLSRTWFSLLIAASPLLVGGGGAVPDPSPAPVVTPSCRFSAAPPDDCAVPALLVPGGGALAPFCANDTPEAARLTSAAIKTVDVLAITESPFMIQRRGPLPGSPADV